MKKLWLVYVLGWLPALCFAQTTSIKGIIINKTNRLPVEYASITNSNTKATTIANAKGLFTIDAEVGHLLYIGSVGFYIDTLRITQEMVEQPDVAIELKQLVQQLASVSVSSKLSPYQIDSMQRRQDYFGTRSSHKLTTFSNANSGAGVGFNLDRFYGKEKKRRNWIDFFATMEREQYINYRFSAALVQKYTSLQGEALYQFLQNQRPTYEWLRAHKSEEDIIYYINEKLKAMKQRPQ